ncbi:MAG: hypothetical protein A2017_05585 [Lentisphaerae bacterium GWF2_44_16]|nr:MAG: hypothetical protein A2017_05585 [Lentisphaerae bacterium GWF2_44_16]
MFFLKMKNCSEINIHDRNYFLSYLKNLNLPVLKNIDWDKVQFYWNSDMKIPVIACFSQWHPDKIFLCAYAKVYSMLIGSTVHEFVHMAQMKRYGFFLYTLLNIPFLREWTLEREARKYESLTETLINK